jgi:hypothetical protein
MEEAQMASNHRAIAYLAGLLGVGFCLIGLRISESWTYTQMSNAINKYTVDGIISKDKLAEDEIKVKFNLFFKEYWKEFGQPLVEKLCWRIQWFVYPWLAIAAFVFFSYVGMTSLPVDLRINQEINTYGHFLTWHLVMFGSQEDYLNAFGIQPIQNTSTDSGSGIQQDQANETLAKNKESVEISPTDRQVDSQ